MLRDKVVLVTGGGGSIGSELVIALLTNDNPPVQIIVIDISEYNLYAVEQKVIESKKQNGIAVLYLLTDVRHQWVMCRVIVDYRPDVIFHAAALKHVPMLETPHNAIEAIRTNIGGSQVVYNCAVDCQVKTFVLVSTDKAVNPISMMGATKTFAEGYCQEMGRVHIETEVVIVRFGNVVGSSGSVVPLFIKQIEDGGPVTVTHPKMMRFFMSIREAVDLIISAATFGRGTYILDMGDERSIDCLARELIEEAGKTGEVEIVYTGTRPGEKYQEELVYEDECMTPTSVPKVRKVATLTPRNGFVAMSYILMSATESRDLGRAIGIIKRVVPYTGGIECEVL